jgi:hypothetical protein
MAQYRSDKKIIDSQQVTTRYEVMMLSDQLTAGGTLIDAFGRLRTTSPYTLFDNIHRYTDDTRNWDIVTSGTGSSNHSVNSSSIFMTVGTASGDKVIRQTKRYFLYQPGKSLSIMNTFTMQPKANVRQRVGYFDTNDGIFLEHDGSQLYIVKRSSVSGTVVETRVPQSQWSEDKFDGTGYSRATLDITKSHIFWIDIEWLGVGTVRAGFVINGVVYTAHKFHHANIGTSTYMASATLPLRYEIENTGTSSSSTSLEHICNTINSEGGHTPKVFTRAVSNPLTGVNVSNILYTPLIALRLKSGRPGGVVVPTGGNLYGIQSTPFKYVVIENATIVGGTWESADSESHVEYNITATSYTGGQNLLQGMFTGGTGVSVTNVDFKKFNSSYQLKTRIDGTSEVFLLAAQATTINDDATGTLVWEEHN